MTRLARAPRVLGLAAMAMLVASCTFPSVDYYEEPATDGGGGAAPMSGCNVPATCSTEVNTCAKPPRSKLDACDAKCNGIMAQPCRDACQSNYEAAVSVCLSQCQDCSAKYGCLNATQSCRALLGLP
jgi:hypothetical protein